jgi:hypothetical protein
MSNSPQPFPSGLCFRKTSGRRAVVWYHLAKAKRGGRDAGAEVKQKRDRGMWNIIGYISWAALFIWLVSVLENNQTPIIMQSA